jgi:hypothetical protein
MQVTKGLVIADPWIGYILDGSKTWEMRSTQTSIRGPFGLIRKGTGTICGVATLVDVGRPLTLDEMVTSFVRHRIPGDMIRAGEVAKWNVPWLLSGVRQLAHPVAYDHPSGAVTWVNLAPEVSQQIAEELKSSISPVLLQSDSEPSHPDLAGSAMKGRLLVQTGLTEGNIKNNHFYLRGHLDRFPSDLIGGSNKDAKAPKEAAIDWGGPNLTTTDIDGEKQFFRMRGWIRKFFESTNAHPGDWVLVEETAPYRYKISLKKA